MAEMTGKERYLCCLHGETPDKVPILHWSIDLAQALSGVPMHQFAFDPNKMALGHLSSLEEGRALVRRSFDLPTKGR
jgi:hypothetical protein